MEKNILNEKSGLDNANHILKLSYKKYKSSKRVFVALSLTSLLISVIVIILNLYAIRFNIYPVQLMPLFVAISVIGVLVSFIVTIQSFFNLSNEKHRLKDKIEINIETVRKIANNEPMTTEEFDDRLSNL